jgi:iron complex transport system permease protein
LRNQRLIIVLLLALLAITFVIASASGAMFISPGRVIAMLLDSTGITSIHNYTDQERDVFFMIRLPRVILCLLVGAGLAIAGTIMQALFQNPMAGPGITGASAGSSLFATLFIIIAGSFHLPAVISQYALAFFAFAGAAVITLLVYKISTTGKKSDKSSLLLAGIAMNALAMSVVGFCIFIADDAQLRTITFWSLGSTAAATWQTVMIVFVVLTVVYQILRLRYLPVLNILSLGEAD